MDALERGLLSKSGDAKDERQSDEIASPNNLGYLSSLVFMTLFLW